MMPAVATAKDARLFRTRALTSDRILVSVRRSNRCGWAHHNKSREIDIMAPNTIIMVRNTTIMVQLP